MPTTWYLYTKESPHPYDPENGPHKALHPDPQTIARTGTTQTTTPKSDTKNINTKK